MRVCQFRHPGRGAEQYGAREVGSTPTRPFRSSFPRPPRRPVRLPTPVLSRPDSKPAAHRSIAQNRKARHEYLILDELECGIALLGSEVKTLREGHCSLQEAYAQIKGRHDGELWLLGANIPEYRHATHENHSPTRDRKLLAHRQEIDKWTKQVREKGVTIVPLELYFSGSRVKVRLGLVRGKKLHDKRAQEREKAAKREMDRATKRSR